MFEPLLTAEGMMSLLTLTVMEIVLGIDNVIFISILSGRLELKDQGKARMIGLALALIMRIILLYTISWIVGFDKPLITDFFGMDISVRDLILFAGGLFLIYKSTAEIHDKLEGPEEGAHKGVRMSLFSAIIQIVLLDIVFSFDSILTAIGLVEDPTRDLIIMVIAVVISLFIMLLFARPISNFVNTHPTIKMLALSFLLMIGLLLVAEGFHKHIPKGYIYFAMSFSLFVEILNLRSKKKANDKALKLKNQPELKKEDAVLTEP